MDRIKGPWYNALPLLHGDSERGRNPQTRTALRVLSREKAVVTLPGDRRTLNLLLRFHTTARRHIEITLKNQPHLQTHMI